MKEKIQSYRDLKVWQKAFELVILVYKITEKFPKSELYGLISDMRRAAVSIPSNIAEGYHRRYAREYLHFLSIAYGSSGELETQLLLSKRLGFIEERDFEVVYELNTEVSKMLFSLIKAVKRTTTA